MRKNYPQHFFSNCNLKQLTLEILNNCSLGHGPTSCFYAAFELNILASLASALLIFGLLVALKVGVCSRLKIFFGVSVSKTKICMLNLSVTNLIKLIQYLNWQLGMLNANWLSKALAN